MKSIFIVLFCITSTAFYSQQRFIYLYNHNESKVDSTNFTTNVMYLDIYKEGSAFYDYEEFQLDSLNIHLDHSISKNSLGIIFKTFPNYAIYETVKLANYLYKVADNRNMVWTLLNENDIINDMKVQKATVNFAGRNWNAWFTNSISITDGPYKFHGLPGLIVKIEDEEKTHLFELTEIRKNPNKKIIDNIKNIPISFSQYKKLYREETENPAKRFIQNGVKISENSDISSDNAFIKRMAEYYKKNKLENNNILDLDLLKNNVSK